MPIIKNTYISISMAIIKNTYISRSMAIIQNTYTSRSMAIVQSSKKAACGDHGAGNRNWKRPHRQSSHPVDCSVSAQSHVYRVTP